MGLVCPSSVAIWTKPRVAASKRQVRMRPSPPPVTTYVWPSGVARTRKLRTCDECV